MLAILAAALLATAPQNDTVFMADGGRVVGTVIEEAPRGVTIQLPDGTVRRYPARNVLRIEYADGTVSPSRQGPAPAQQPEPAQAAPPQAAPPQAAPPAQPGPAEPPPPRPYEPQPPPPPRAYSPPPPAYPPRSYEQPTPRGPAYPPQAQQPRDRYAGMRGVPPISPFYGVLGIGGLGMSGEVERGLSTSRVFEPQVEVLMEGGARLSPMVALGLYLDLGVGEPAAEVRAECATSGATCTGATARFGILLRHTFMPYAPSTPWVAIGTGFEVGTITTDGHMGGSNDYFSYSGWEALRLMAGLDLRTTPFLGFGVYGAVSFGRYSRYEDAAGSLDLGRQPFHTTAEAGLRMTLFP